jgi:quercetin dioxygenase-like cupin family protein
MSTIESILSELKSTTNPVVKALYKGENFKVITIGLNKDAILKDHQTEIPAKLTILTGSVVYKEGDKEVRLNQYDEHHIPINCIHSLRAVEFSLCLLIQG